MGKLSKYARSTASTPQESPLTPTPVESQTLSSVPLKTNRRSTLSKTVKDGSPISGLTKRVTRPRRSPTLDDTPPTEVVHIAPTEVLGIRPRLCGSDDVAADDPERVALVPVYHWCRSCLAAWKRIHGRPPVLATLERWQVEKYELWLKTWREKRVVKRLATEAKQSREDPKRPTEQTYFPPKVLTMEEFRRLYPPDKEAD